MNKVEDIYKKARVVLIEAQKALAKAEADFQEARDALNRFHGITQAGYKEGQP